jgi:glycosyltransferase involved in cell wall biosynthesis
MTDVNDDRVWDVELSIVVPVFNERDTVDPLVERVRDTLETLDLGWEMVVVDDGSDDGSGERLDELARIESHLRVLHFTANNGQSAALDAGFRHARGSLIGVLDADLQTYPEDLPRLLEALTDENVDAVVGIRAERRDSGWKRFSSWFANSVRNRLTREDVVDTGCPLKVIRSEAIRTIVPFDGMHRFLPTLLRMEGFSVVQVPVRHTARVSGSSSYGTWDRAFRGLRDALGVRWLQDRHLRWRLR